MNVEILAKVQFDRRTSGGPVFTRKSPALEICDLSQFFSDHFSPGTLAIRLDSFLIIHVRRGTGSCLLDMIENCVTGDSFYCLYPGQLIAPGENTVLEGTAITFTREFLCSSRNDVLTRLIPTLFNIQSPRLLAVKEGAKPDTLQLLQSMMKEYSSNGELRQELLRSLLRVLIIILSKDASVNFSVNSSRQEVDHVNAFYELVNSNFVRLKRVSEYAKLLSLSSNYLNLLVKKFSGFSAKHYIQQQIILEAKRQMHWEGKSLKEIGYSLGFIDCAHFSKFFKNVNGSNFSEFKRARLLS
jgi:AraC family transcriptional activator of pobA